jgi:hypothetical protein
MPSTFGIPDKRETDRFSTFIFSVSNSWLYSGAEKQNDKRYTCNIFLMAAKFGGEYQNKLQKQFDIQ